MGLNLKRWLLEKTGIANESEMEVSEFLDALQEYRIREFAANVCINTIANAIGKCEFKTYKNQKEVKENEYYSWNIEPNPNQNSTNFLHKLVYKLYAENEVLVISVKGNGKENLYVADSFTLVAENPTKQNYYDGVTVGEYTYPRKFYENEVLHIKLNNCNISPIVNAIYTSYTKLINAATKDYIWSNGKHYKLHISTAADIGVAKNGKDKNTIHTEKIEKQAKPFLQSQNGILPEFEGYEYKDMSGNIQKTTRDIKAMIDDIFEFTARGFGIPPVLLLGNVEGTEDAMTRWLTTCIDPLCDQIQEEINRKRYGFSDWKKGNYIQIDTSAIMHFDVFANAANIEKLIGSGVYTHNDVRKLTGQSEIDEEWANKCFITKNFATMEEMLKGGDNDEKNVGNQTISTG